MTTPDQENPNPTSDVAVVEETVAAAPAPAPAPIPQTDNRRRQLRDLLSIPERDRTDEQWDQIIELEIQLAPGNRLAPNENPHNPPRHNNKPGGGNSGGQQKKHQQHRARQGGNRRPRGNGNKPGNA